MSQRQRIKELTIKTVIIKKVLIIVSYVNPIKVLIRSFKEVRRSLILSMFD